MMWLGIVPQILQKFGVAIIGVFSLFIMGRNSRLARENDKLKTLAQEAATEQKYKAIELENRVLDVVQHTENTDIDGSIKRMRKKSL